MRFIQKTKIMSVQKKPLSEKEEKRIWSFVKDQTVLNFATSKNDVPWCASCYYALEEEYKLLVFKTDMKSRHMEEANKQIWVAGTILPDKQKKGIVIGVQYQGKMVLEDEERVTKARKRYYKKFPFAKAMDGEIAVLELTHVKLTDNKLGFGKRLVWEKL
jgi:uncharacterized protein YhbP (UPF0306 family)